MTDADSTLHQRLSRARSPIAKFEAYMQACRDVQWTNPDQALPFAKQARTVAKSMRDAAKELHAVRMIGICYYASHEYEAAFKHFSFALQRYRKLRDTSGVARALQNVGLALRGLGRNEEALACYRESEQLLRALKDDEILAKVLNNIGSVCTVLNHLAPALEAYVECLMIAEGRGDTAVFAQLMGNIAGVYVAVGDAEIALDWSKRALEEHRRNGDKVGIALTLSTMSRVLQATADHPAALSVATESLAVMTELGDTLGIARSTLALSELYLERRQFSRAAAFAEDALEIFTSHHEVDRRLRCLVILANIARQRSRTDEARDMIADARKVARRTDNHPLHADVELVAAEVELQAGNAKGAIQHLQRALRITKQHALYGAQARIARLMASIVASGGDFKQALAFERLGSSAQSTYDDQLRARHGQALQLRLDMERAQRAWEVARHEGERLQFQLDTQSRELNTSALAIAQKNELLSSIVDEIRAAIDAPAQSRGTMLRSLTSRIEHHRRSNDEWKAFSEQLKDVHDDFHKALVDRCPTLTPTEHQLASLLRLHLSSKEIAEILNVNAGTVEIYRSRLRKKLSIPSSTSLTVFFQSL